MSILKTLNNLDLCWFAQVKNETHAHGACILIHRNENVNLPKTHTVMWKSGIFKMGYECNLLFLKYKLFIKAMDIICSYGGVFLL